MLQIEFLFLIHTDYYFNTKFITSDHCILFDRVEKEGKKK